MVIKDGRFGPYVTDGETNASLRRGMSVEAMTLEQASQMLMERRAQGPAAPRKKAAKKAAVSKKATKSASKKATAKKVAAKKVGSKKATKSPT